MNDRPEKKPKTVPFLMVPKHLAARTDLHPIDKLVWACIRDRIGNNGKAWPGGRKLAADLGVTRPTVLDALDRLAAAGDLLVEKRGRGRTNHYRTPPASGQEPLPVETPKRSRTLTSPNAGSGQEPLRAVVKNLDPNTDPLNQTHKGEAAAPPVVDEKASESNGTAGRIMAAWCRGFKSRTGSTVAQGAKGRLAGTVKRLLADFDESALTGSVAAWFSKDRGDYGVELFEKKLQGGDRDLLPRPEQAPKRDEYSERKLAEMRGHRP
jgi:hypothetical protein